MTNGELLLKASLERPEELSIRLEYADWLDEQAGERNEELPCPRARFVRMGFHPGWIPLTPRGVQWDWVAQEKGEAWFAGECGVGKTTALLMAALRNATSGDYEGVLMAPTHQALTQPGGIEETLCKWLTGRKRGAEYDRRLMMWRFKSGAVLRLSHFEGSNFIGGTWESYDLYLRRHAGLSFCFLGIERIAAMGTGARDGLRYSCRARGNLPAQVRGTY